MDKKKRRSLITKATKLTPVINIGLKGITDLLIIEVEKVLEARELIKINVGKQCPQDIDECADFLIEKTHSELIVKIGRKIVLYREKEDEKTNIKK